MKYRFSSLDQILHSPLFDFSASYQPPKRTDRSTRSTRLGDMDFEAASAPYDPEDDVLPQAKADLSRTPVVLCAAAEAAGTAEQIQYVSSMVSDTLRRER